jgi:hypothetical protein
MAEPEVTPHAWRWGAGKSCKVNRVAVWSPLHLLTLLSSPGLHVQLLALGGAQQANWHQDLFK